MARHHDRRFLLAVLVETIAARRAERTGLERLGRLGMRNGPANLLRYRVAEVDGGLGARQTGRLINFSIGYALANRELLVSRSDLEVDQWNRSEAASPSSQAVERWAS